LGAGWNVREHEAFGFDLLDMDARFKRYEEGVQVVQALTRSPKPVSFQGEYFTLKDAMLSPRSPRSDGPPLVIGGNGPKRTLPLAAKYADEWNAVGLKPEEFRERCQILDELLQKEGREPGSVKRTMMTRGVAAADQASLEAKMSADDRARISERGAIVGTPDEIVDILGRQAEAGVQGVMLQWLDMDDISGLELIAGKVLPQLK
jgi:alkanesulfonate monooxygenase SsuD/methylene tetrahydromethanopterin reductase-like flavin-dependent oxidoreductase (luciferase family)